MTRGPEKENAIMNPDWSFVPRLLELFSMFSFVTSCRRKCPNDTFYRNVHFYMDIIKHIKMGHCREWQKHEEKQLCWFMLLLSVTSFQSNQSSMLSVKRSQARHFVPTQHAVYLVDLCPNHSRRTNQRPVWSYLRWTRPFKNKSF